MRPEARDYILAKTRAALDKGARVAGYVYGFNEKDPDHKDKTEKDRLREKDRANPPGSIDGTDRVYDKATGGTKLRHPLGHDMQPGEINNIEDAASYLKEKRIQEIYYGS